MIADWEVKQNVTLTFNSWTLRMIRAARIAYSKAGLDKVVVTSGLEGHHALLSSHYENRAVDFGRPESDDLALKVVDLVRLELSDKFFIQLEHDHIHAQAKREASPYD